MAKRGRHKGGRNKTHKQFCPKDHDTFIVGRNKKGMCIQCDRDRKHTDKVRQKSRERYEENKIEINAKRKNKYIAHPLPLKQFCALGHDTFKEGRNKSGFCKKCLLLAVKKYRLRHPEVVKLLSIKCDSERRLRIAKFGQSGITKFYRSMPSNMTADHIIPLKGEFVSGLHVIWNLQYLPPSENFSKQNRIDLMWASEWYGKLLEKAGLK